MNQPLKIYVAVDDRGTGYVLSWDGDDTPRDDYELSPCEAFAEEVSNEGRHCEYLSLPNPRETAGLHVFDGEMVYRGNATNDDREPEFRGTWSVLKSLWPTEVPSEDEEQHGAGWMGLYPHEEP